MFFKIIINKIKKIIDNTPLYCFWLFRNKKHFISILLIFSFSSIAIIIGVNHFYYPDKKLKQYTFIKSSPPKSPQAVKAHGISKSICLALYDIASLKEEVTLHCHGHPPASQSAPLFARTATLFESFRTRKVKHINGVFNPQSQSIHLFPDSSQTSHFYAWTNRIIRTVLHEKRHYQQARQTGSYRLFGLTYIAQSIHNPHGKRLFERDAKQYADWALDNAISDQKRDDLRGLIRFEKLLHKPKKEIREFLTASQSSIEKPESWYLYMRFRSLNRAVNGAFNYYDKLPVQLKRRKEKISRLRQAIQKTGHYYARKYDNKKIRKLTNAITEKLNLNSIEN